jgi:hypothetical protein
MLSPQTGFVTQITFFGHVRCPQERLGGIAETDGTEPRTSPPLKMGIANR